MKRNRFSRQWLVIQQQQQKEHQQEQHEQQQYDNIISQNLHMQQCLHQQQQRQHNQLLQQQQQQHTNHDTHFLPYAFRTATSSSLPATNSIANDPLTTYQLKSQQFLQVLYKPFHSKRRRRRSCLLLDQEQEQEKEQQQQHQPSSIAVQADKKCNRSCTKFFNMPLISFNQILEVLLALLLINFLIAKLTQLPLAAAAAYGTENTQYPFYTGFPQAQAIRPPHASASSSSLALYSPLDIQNNEYSDHFPYPPTSLEDQYHDDADDENQNLSAYYREAHSIGGSAFGFNGLQVQQNLDDTLLRSQNFKISPKTCSMGRIEGTCMFVWECIKSKGRHVGMCVDGFMFGSCCAHNYTDTIDYQNTFSYTRPTKPVGIASFNHRPRPPQHPHKPSIIGMTTIERPHGAGTLVIRPSGPHHQGPLNKPNHSKPFYTSTATLSNPSSSTTTTSTSSTSTSTTTTTDDPSLLWTSNSVLNDLQSAASIASGAAINQQHWHLTTEPNFITKPRPPSWDKPTSFRPKPSKPSKKPIHSSVTTTTTTTGITNQWQSNYQPQKPQQQQQQQQHNQQQQYQQQQHQSPIAQKPSSTHNPYGPTKKPTKYPIYSTLAAISTTEAPAPSSSSSFGNKPKPHVTKPPASSSTTLSSSSSSMWSSSTSSLPTTTTKPLAGPSSAHYITKPYIKPTSTSTTTSTMSSSSAAASTTTTTTALMEHKDRPTQIASSTTTAFSTGVLPTKTTQKPGLFSQRPASSTSSLTSATAILSSSTSSSTPGSSAFNTIESNEIGNSIDEGDNDVIRTVSAARSECGMSALTRPETRIVGGKTAPFGRWPWQVSVRRTSFFGFSSTHRCGGALINENWIATAGHCVEDLLYSQLRIRVGEYDFSHVQAQLPYIERGVERKLVHPKYNFYTFEYDLALVKMEQPLEFAPHISPICLPQTDSLLIGMNATVTGWGRLSEGGTLPSVLQEVTVPIMSNDKCKSMFLRAGRQEFIPDIFLCAGFETGGQDSCQGDSGGPLQVKSQNGHYFLAGIISWGIGCAEANLPGVLTRISKFVPWIMENVT